MKNYKYNILICLGPGRSGSTFLYESLSKILGKTDLHQKENDILNTKVLSDSPVVSFSNTLIYDNDVSDRFQKFASINHQKEIILFILSRPSSSRLISLAKFQLATGRLKNLSDFKKYVENNCDRVFYAKNLEKIIQNSPSNVKFCIVPHQRLSELSALCSALGLEFKSEIAKTDRNASMVPRFVKLMPILRGLYVVLTKFFGKRLTYILKKNKTLKKVFYNNKKTVYELDIDTEKLCQDHDVILSNLYSKLIPYDKLLRW